MYLKTIQIFSLLVCALIMFVVPAGAQQTGESSEEIEDAALPMVDEHNAVIHFVSIGRLSSAVTQDLYYRLDGEYVSFRITNASRGRNYAFSSRSELVIYRKGQDAKGKVIYSPIINRPIPSSADAYIVFFAEVKEQLFALAYDDSLKAHPRNTVRFHNLSTNDLMGIVNGKKITLGARETLLFPVDTKTLTHLNVDLRAKDHNGVWRPSYQRSSQVVPNMRMNIIAGNRPTQSERRGHILLTYRLIDHMPPEMD